MSAFHTYGLGQFAHASAHLAQLIGEVFALEGFPGFAQGQVEGTGSQATADGAFSRRAAQGVFDDLIKHRRLMSDPSILVTNPTYTEPGLAPPGKHVYYVLFPTPNLDADIDWRTFEPRYREHVFQTLEERGYRGFADAVETMHITTPQDWADQGMERGSPFASAHTLLQTGPFRPGNLWGENVVFTGSGTQPGVGVPPVLVSGHLAAQRILGPTE